MSEYTARNSTEALPLLAQALLSDGTMQDSRNGKTLELLYPHITLTHPWEREITNPIRKASLPAQIAETVWVLSGRNDVGWLSRYLPRAADFSDDGEVWRAGYGPRIRSWNGVKDQLETVVHVLGQDRDSRRAVINIWDPLADSVPGKDIPCNNWLHFLIRNGKLHLHVSVRSNDLIWGWSGINAFEWSMLQEIVAWCVGVDVGELHFSTSSLHAYEQHFDRLGRMKMGPGVPGTSHAPRFDPNNPAGVTDPVLRLDLVDDLLSDWMDLEEDLRTGKLVTQAEIDAFPEPLLRDWIRVIAWKWKRIGYSAVKDGRTRRALLYSVDFTTARAAETEPAAPVADPSDEFASFVSELHAGKHKAYGDSWKKRGEMLGIMANIARKMDRLGIPGGGDSAADTAIDLLCYLAKYRLWLHDSLKSPVPADVASAFTADVLSDHAEPVSVIVSRAASKYDVLSTETLIARLEQQFQLLEDMVTRRVADRYLQVDAMLPYAATLARRLWLEEKEDDYRGADHD